MALTRDKNKEVQDERCFEEDWIIDHKVIFPDGFVKTY